MSQTDIQRFQEVGTVDETLQIGPASSQRIVYRLVRDEAAPSISATLENNVLAITIPGSEALEWTDTSQVGIKGFHTSSNGSKVNILVEKDFACLTPRVGDDDKDTFPNPGAPHGH